MQSTTEQGGERAGVGEGQLAQCHTFPHFWFGAYWLILRLFDFFFFSFRRVNNYRKKTDTSRTHSEAQIQAATDVLQYRAGFQGTRRKVFIFRL